MSRRSPTYDKRQKLTRIPPYRPGDVVKVREFANPAVGNDLSGKVLRVKAVTCSFTRPDQPRAIWRIHFADGRCLEWHLIERLATDDEIRRANHDRRAA